MATVAQLRGSWRRSAKAAARRRAAADVVLALSAELSTGLPLDVALRRAGEDREFMVRSVGAVRVGGDVPAALRADAAEFDLVVLAALAAVWQVSAGSGAGLSDAAYRLGAAALQRERLRRDLASQMAGPKATARVLALLPLIGLVLGSGLGGSPFGWLLGTPAGWGVLVVGVTLEVIGVIWVRRLVGSVEKHL
jgi:tight adherence protein B